MTLKWAFVCITYIDARRGGHRVHFPRGSGISVCNWWCSSLQDSGSFVFGGTTASKYYKDRFRAPTDSKPGRVLIMKVPISVGKVQSRNLNDSEVDRQRSAARYFKRRR